MEQDTFTKQSYSILVVDDTLLYRSYAQDTLKKAGYTVYTAESGKQALGILQKIQPNLILLDIVMEEMDGYETYENILKNSKIRHIPVVFLTAETEVRNELRGFHMGAADYISKPFVPEIMLKRIERVIRLDRLQADLEQEVMIKTKRLEQVSLQAISTIAATIDAKDRYTRGHSERVAKIAVEIAKKLGLAEEKQEEIHSIALLHDIGKIGIPDLILNKPTKLTGEEYAIIKSHTEIGSEILKDISVIPDIRDGARWHHERFDGKGYPDGLKGTQIPLTARIIGIADAYDAMSSKRPYRNVLPTEYIISELSLGKGTQFDSHLTDIMLELIEEGLEIVQTTERTAIKGDFVSESSTLLYEVYNQSLQSNMSSLVFDPTTQLYARRYVEGEIKERLLKLEKNGYLVLVDINSFGITNDTYGYVTGDNLLILLADSLRLNVGEYDLIGRMENDEFVIYLRDCPSEQELRVILEKITTNFHKEKGVMDYKNMASLSFGVTQVLADDRQYIFDTLYYEAHTALLSNKQQQVLYTMYDEVLNKTELFARKLEEDMIKLEEYIAEREDSKEEKKSDEYEICFQITRQLSKQKSRHIDFLLFTLATNKKSINEEDVWEAMGHLKNAVRLSMRQGELDMQFGESEYLLILTNASERIANTIAMRVEGYFNKLADNQNIELVHLYRRLY